MAAATATPRSGALRTWLQAPATSSRPKRGRDAGDSGEDVSITSSVPASDKWPAKKKRAKDTSTPKASKPTTKPSAAAKEAKKLYTETLKAVDKRYTELDKKVKAMSPNSSSITVSNYATSAAKHLNTAKKLADMDPVLAFNFIMALADASHRSMSTWKMSGESGACDTAFGKLDQALLPLMEKRAAPTSRLAELPEVPHRWTEEDAEVGVFKTGRPNKQQRGQMDRQYIDWEKKRREARRARREACEDWVTVALVDLVEEWDYLERFGVGTDFSTLKGEGSNSYLKASIAKLEALKAERL